MNARPLWAVSAGMTVALVVTLALLAACIAVVVGISTYQHRAIRRAKPWLLRMLHIRGEVTVLEATTWVAQHHEALHHMLISRALWELEHDDLAESRLREDDHQQRDGHPERLYKLVSDPAVAAALWKLVDTCDRVEAKSGR